MNPCALAKCKQSHRLSRLWLRLHSTTHASCFVRRFGDQVEQVNIYLWHDDSTENLQICAFIQRALHFRSHSTCCYRGCILHLLHASLRVDSNVISFLVRQIICFLLISFCTSALVIIMSYARTLRNPSAFSPMHSMSHLLIYIIQVAVFNLWECSDALCDSLWSCALLLLCS